MEFFLTFQRDLNISLLQAHCIIFMYQECTSFTRPSISLTINEIIRGGIQLIKFPGSVRKAFLVQTFKTFYLKFYFI